MIDEEDLDDLFGEQEEDYNDELVEDSLSKAVSSEKESLGRDMQDIIESSAKQDILMLLKAPEIYRLDQEVCELEEAQDALKEAFEECSDDRKAAELHQRALLTTRAIIGKDGTTVHSNTRLIQWSDGSFSLYLNSGKVHLEILRQDPLGREYLFHPTPQDGGSMIGAGRFEERLVVKPPPAAMIGRPGEENDEIAALASQSRRQESSSSQKVKLMAVATTVDPELEKSRMAKLELERTRMRRKQEEARRRLIERERSSSRNDSRPSSTLELSRYLEEESDPDDGDYQSDHSISDANGQDEQSQQSSNDSDSDSNQLGKTAGSKRKSRSIRIVDE